MQSGFAGRPWMVPATREKSGRKGEKDAGNDDPEKPGNSQGWLSD